MTASRSPPSPREVKGVITMAIALPLFSLCPCPTGYSLSFFVTEPIWSYSHDFNGEIKIKLVILWVYIASQGFSQFTLIWPTLLRGLLFFLAICNSFQDNETKNTFATTVSLPLHFLRD
jgi:hypothetical protein